MSFFNEYPYTDFHELNLDWIIKDQANVHKEMKETHEYIETSIEHIDAQTEEATRQAENSKNSAEASAQSEQKALEYKNEIQESADTIHQNSQDILVLDNRIDSITAGGTAPSEAEVLDARTGFQGQEYTSLGDSIRGQVEDEDTYIYTNMARFFQNTLISGSTKKWSSNTGGDSMVFKVQPGDKLVINPIVRDAFYAILKTFTYPEIGEDVDFATGFDSYKRILPGTTESITIPNDGYFLWILSRENTYNRIPKTLTLNGYDLTQGLVSNINRNRNSISDLSNENLYFITNIDNPEKNVNTYYSNRFELYADNQYMDGDGVLYNHVSGSVYKLPKFNGYISIVSTIGAFDYAIIDYGSGHIKISSANTSYAIDSACDVYLNVNKANESAFKVQITTGIRNTQIDRIELLDYENHVGTQGQNSIMLTKFDVTKIRDNFDLYFPDRTGTYPYTDYAYAYNENDEYVKALQAGVNDIGTCTYLQIYTNVDNHEVFLVPKVKMNFTNSVFKRDLTNKKIAFFGDSIVRGDGASPMATENWCHKFSDLVGADTISLSQNYGVSGAGFSEKSKQSSGIDTILDKIQATTFDADVIFVGGGTNDFGYGVSLGAFSDDAGDDFTSGLRNTIEYLKTTYPNKRIIFITPIKRPRFSRLAKYSLDSYVKRMIEILNVYNVEYIVGDNIPFDYTYSDYETDITYDNLHPNNKGYTMYANYLYRELT